MARRLPSLLAALLAPLACAAAEAALPEETVAALKAWHYEKKYRYIIAEMPNLSQPVLGDRDATYADFKTHLTKCAGVCIAGYDFFWEHKSGQPIGEQTVWTYAPDVRPEHLDMKGYMKLKMGMPHMVKQFRDAINLDGALFQVNDEDDFDPHWVAYRLKDGKYNVWKDRAYGEHAGHKPEGQALVELLEAQLKAGPTVDAVPVEASDTSVAQPPSSSGRPAYDGIVSMKLETDGMTAPRGSGGSVDVPLVAKDSSGAGRQEMMTAAARKVVREALQAAAQWMTE